MNKLSAGDIDLELQLLLEIIEHIPIGILVLDSDGRVVMMNRWQEEISRINRKKILGNFFHEKWPRLFSQGIMNGYWDLLQKGKPFDVTVHEVHPQFYDQKITAISRGVPLPDNKGFILLHEISEEMKRDKQGLEKLKDKLAEAHNFLINLINASPNIVITTGTTDRIRSVNLTGEKEFGYSEKEFLGKPIATLFADSFSLEGLTETQSQGLCTEVPCIRKDGSTFPARFQVRKVVTKSGKFQAKLVLLSDISREKQMEEKLALSQKLAIYSELLAGIAHQLNNPLIGVVNFSSLLLEKVDPNTEIRELAETIHSAAQQCRDMLASLIKSIREPQSLFHELDIEEILKGALAAAQQQEPEASSKCTVDLKIAKDLAGVKGDYLQMLETFRNIIVNAFQAMPEGGNVEMSAKKVKEKRTLQIQVSDLGPGIPKSEISKVFDPFYSTKQGKGTGLGLSFAFQVIKSHGGRIDCLQQKKRGAVFRVELPYVDEREEI